MSEVIRGYIAACEENLARYREIGDQRAINAALVMIAQFESMLNELSA